MTVSLYVCAILALCTALAVPVLLLPEIRMVLAAGRGIKKVRRIAAAGGFAELALQPAVCGYERLDRLWRRYLENVKRTGGAQTLDIDDYLTAELTRDNSGSWPPADVFPAGITAAGVLASAVLLLRSWQMTGRMEPDSLYAALAGAGLGFVFLVLHALVSSVFRRSLKSFAQAVRDSAGTGGGGTAALLAAISAQLQKQSEEQRAFYDEFTDRASERLEKSVVPVLEQIGREVAEFVEAASGRQAESMDNLAGRFSDALTGAFARQMDDMSESARRMSEIQRGTAETFEMMRQVMDQSVDQTTRLNQSTGALFARLDGTLERLAALSDEAARSASVLNEVAGLIAAHSGRQSDTIEHLVAGQRQLTEISKLYVDNMNSVVADLRDQYTSTMIGLRAASADMVRSGDHLREAYEGFSVATLQNITEVFRQFDENLTSISAHLARSITELQQAVDELPLILRHQTAALCAPEESK